MPPSSVANPEHDPRWIAYKAPPCFVVKDKELSCKTCGRPVQTGAELINHAIGKRHRRLSRTQPAWRAANAVQAELLNLSQALAAGEVLRQDKEERER